MTLLGYVILMVFSFSEYKVLKNSILGLSFYIGINAAEVSFVPL